MLERSSVAQYHQMVASGVLLDGDPVELFEGVLVERMTEGPAHASRITRLTRLLLMAVGDGPLQVRAQNPISMIDSELEPDLAIVADLDYSLRHPTSSEIEAVIEVAGSSLARDRSSKQRIYANAGISHYIIVNLPDNVVESYTAPISGDDPRFSRHETLTSGRLDIGPVSVDVAELTHTLSV
jgi:Uma2 family endonuclease